MLDWFQRLMPHTLLFFPLFERHAITVAAAAESLRQMLEGGDHASEHCRDVMRYEEEADGITREVLNGIRITFITPFDRGDIKDLITSLDDAIDEMKKTAKAIALFELSSFEPDMCAMGDAIVECAHLVVRATPLLANIGQNAGQLNEICFQVTQIERRGDELDDTGLKILYERSKAVDHMEFVRGKEIYEHLEQVIDSLDDVCDQIQAVIIEHA